MHLPANTSLKNGKYQIVRCLGQGGYGITYLATTRGEMTGNLGSLSMKVPVAIKEFFVKTYSTRDEATLDVVVHTEEGKALVPQLMRDFCREAKSMSEMQHPNIVNVIEIFEEHDTVYYVMEYLEGGSLADKVGAAGPLGCDKAKAYTYQIGSALAYIHERRICHYDVKPANIMLPDENKAVLIDFGISRHYDDQGNATTVRPVGYSNGFSSPEQVAGNAGKFSPASDIYSLAALLFFMVTGETPSESGKLMGNRPENIPQEIWNAVVTGMNKDAGKRPQTVNQWLALLDDKTKARPAKVAGEDKKKEVVTGKVDRKKKEEKKNETGKTDKEDGIGKPGGLPPFNLKKWWMLISCVALCIIAAFLFFRVVKPGKAKGQAAEVRGMQWNKTNKYGHTYTYTGAVVDSIPNGQGKAVYSNGSTYEGRYVEGLRDDDNASYIDENGNVFKGEFRHDSIVQGRITAANGIYYEGSFRNDQPFQGTWFDKNGEAKLKVENGKQTNTD